MNTNASVTRILCFGDSNTWGRSGSNASRYPANQRWTGLLQKKLGDAYEILEEGLCSRTTDIDDPDPNFPNRNGLEYLRPCLESQYPTDIVILWLGTNDLKTKFKRTAQDISNSISKLVRTIQEVGHTQNNKVPKIIVISPPLIKQEALKKGSQFSGSGEVSKQLASMLEHVSKDCGTAFLDLTKHVDPGEADGVHLELESHPIVAEKFAEIIRSL